MTDIFPEWLSNFNNCVNNCQRFDQVERESFHVIAMAIRWIK